MQPDYLPIPEPTPPPASSCMPGWSQLPGELLASAISDRGVRLWAVVERHQRANGRTWPSRAHLARHLDCSVDSVDRAVLELEAAGWLAVDRSAGGRFSPSRYAVIHNGRTPAAVNDSNGRTGAADTTFTAAPVRTVTAAPVRHRKNSREEETVVPLGAHSSDRARGRCDHGHPIASDASCCHECEQERSEIIKSLEDRDNRHQERPIWPAAVGGQS